MIKGIFPTKQFESFDTPFYYYDMALLRETLNTIRQETAGKPFHIHYAIKANANEEILKLIASYGFGADCVSGNEILRALECKDVIAAQTAMRQHLLRSEARWLVALEAE